MFCRLAPTPSGFLHEGNLFAFLVQEELAKRHGALLGLRIDDLDRERFRPEYLSDVFRCLDALGIVPAFGPRTEEEFYTSYRQELRLSRYREVLEQLKGLGLLYACRCSRKAVSEWVGVGCPGGCAEEHLSFDAPDTLWRLRAPEETVEWEDGFLGAVRVNLRERMGDVVLRRRDGLPAYQITSLTDDRDLQIDLLVRGEDLLESTAVQLWLSEKLWGPAKVLRYHHPLLLSPSGEKLSKSAGAGSKPMELNAEEVAALRFRAAGFGRQRAVGGRQ